MHIEEGTKVPTPEFFPPWNTFAQQPVIIQLSSQAHLPISRLFFNNCYVQVSDKGKSHKIPFPWEFDS